MVTGGRGVLRAHHARRRQPPGSRTDTQRHHKAARSSALAGAELPTGARPDFPLPPRLTVTKVAGGSGYTNVPDLCTLNVDVRLTPAFDIAAAENTLRMLTDQVDATWPGTRPTLIDITTHWPAYQLPDDSPLKTALLTAARQAGLSPAAKIAGPSNIGNYLAGLGIPATAGFGVDHQGLHAADERIRIGSIPPVQATYHQACLTLLSPS
jgi:succinyl-diaminopimelate desuccinylase